jgi:hypothetical protein
MEERGVVGLLRHGVVARAYAWASRLRRLARGNAAASVDAALGQVVSTGVARRHCQAPPTTSVTPVAMTTGNTPGAQPKA